MAECKFMRQDDDEKYCTMFLAKCDSKELEFCCDDNCTVRDMAEENERLKTENKLLKSTIKQINSIGLIEENERLKADNDRIQNNFIQQLEYEKQVLDDAIKYKTCLQEIKTIAEENKDTAQYGGICNSILMALTKAEEE